MADLKTPINKLLDEVEYTETGETQSEDGLPYVTHEGKLNIGGLSITVYMLNTGQRIIPEEEMERVFGIK